MTPAGAFSCFLNWLLYSFIFPVILDNFYVNRKINRNLVKSWERLSLYNEHTVFWMAASLKADFYALKQIVGDQYAMERCPVHIVMLLDFKKL